MGTPLVNGASNEGDGRLLSEPLALAEGVEVVHTDAAVLVRDGRTGLYTRITPTGARLLTLFDGERNASDLVARIAHGDSEQEARIRPLVVGFVRQLDQAGALTVSEQQHDVPRGPRRVGPVYRIPIVHDVDRLVDRIAAPLRCWLSPRALLAFAAVLALVSVALMIGVARLAPPDPGEVVWLALFLTPLLVVAHEGGHAIASRYYGARVREAGVALWFFVLPMAYVDRTDTYGLPSRGQRAATAIAGPLVDLFLGGLAAAVALTAGGALGETAKIFVLFALFALFVNLNPLMSSDGCQSIESLMGSPNGRQRSFRYVESRLRRREPPAGTSSWSGWTRVGAVGYVVASMAWVGFIATGLALFVADLFS